MRIALLGVMQVETDGGVAAEAGGSKQRSVLAQLCRWPNQAVGIDRLAEGVWGERVPPRYRQNLQVYISTLRRVLEPGRPAEAQSRILGHGNAYELVAGPDEIDIAQFDRCCSEGFGALEDGRPDAAAEQLRAALSLWRGEPLVELAAQPFAGDWIEELHDRRRLAVERRIDADLARGLHGELVIELEHLLAARPERERQWAQLIVALYRDGRQADALEAYHRARALLLELGLDPGPRLQELAGQVLRQDPALLGSPPPRSRQLVIPVPLTRALGRDAELAEVLAEVGRGARLVVLAGPGGVGKTRLALAAAHALAESGRDVTWVPLADEGVTAEVPTIVARALGADGVERLDELLAGAQRVLVLDNLEQLIGVGELVVSWLEAAPELQVIATSRSPLGVPGERIEVVHSLAPAVAARLFVERAEANDPTFDHQRYAEDVLALCEQLDGLPLALELAAARVSAFAPGDLVDQISSLARDGDGAGRHGSLRALVQWSTDLLDPSARALLARLAVCDGAVDLDVVAALSAPLGLDRQAAAGSIGALVRAGLSTPVETDAGRRFTMLRTVRAIALDQPGSEAAVLGDLFELFVTRSRAVDPIAHADRARLAAAQADLALTRQVVAALMTAGRAAEAAEIVLAQRKALAMLGRSDETLTLSRALLRENLDAPMAARVSVVAGGCAYVAASPDAGELLSAIDELPDDDAVYRVLGHAWRCTLAADEGDHETAGRHSEECIAIAVGARSPQLEWMACSAAAWAALLRGDAASAVEHGQRQLALAATDSEVAYGLVDLAGAKLLVGDLKAAEACARDAVVAARRLGPSRTLGEAQRCLAIAVLLQGDPSTATALLAETVRFAQRDSDVTGLLELVASIGVSTAAGGRVDEGAELVRRARWFSRRIVADADVFQGPLADLASELGLDEDDTAPSVPIGKVAELVELALEYAEEGATAPSSA